MTLLERGVIDPERIVAWGLNIVGRVLVYTRNGRIGTYSSPEAARLAIGRRLRRQLSLTYA